MKKTVAFVIPRMGGGGAERVVSLLANELCEQGYDITLIPVVGGESFYKLAPAVCYRPLGATLNKTNRWTRAVSELVALPRAFRQLRKLILREKYEVVVSFLFEADLLVSAARLFGGRFRHICTVRNDPTKMKGAEALFSPLIYRKADGFVCQSRMIYEYYQNIPAAKKCVIPNPISPMDPALTQNVVRTKRVVGVGRLTGQKNFALLIESFAKAAPEFPEYSLTIYGEGPLRTALQQQIDAAGLTDRIRLPGAVQDVFAKIADAGLFVMSSDYEGFPNALAEAMALGLPVISTDFPTGVARELIGPDNGRIVPVGDAGAMAAAIRELLSDDELRAKMARSNPGAVKRYSVQQIARQWADVIERA